MITDFSKQVELVKPWEFNKRINVVGCGAGGSWLVLFLYKMGFKNIHVYEFDTVEEHNVPNQAFGEKNIGMLKTQAMAETLNCFTNDCENENAFESQVKFHNKKITSENAHLLSGIVFSCVDSMKARKEIYENCFKYGSAELWIEGRLGLWGAYIYTLGEKNNTIFEEYEKTLYADEESEVSICGVSQTALPSAVNCSSNMIMAMISHYRGNKLDNEIRWQMPDMTTLNSTWGKETIQKEEFVA